MFNKQVKLTKGLTIFLTGLSGAGKTTIANILSSAILVQFKRPVTILDGDVIRQNLTSELGFSKHDRELNVKRVAFIASEINKHGGIVVCAMIAPYKNMREITREVIEKNGYFIEIYVSTPIYVCEKRDPKGLYAKARKGMIKNFTGVDDPYEIPINPDIIIDTTDVTPEQAVNNIISFLKEGDYL